MGNSNLPASAEFGYRRHPGAISQLNTLPTPAPSLTFSILLMITIFCYIFCNCSIFPFLDQFDQTLSHCILMPPSSSSLRSEPMTESLLTKYSTQLEPFLLLTLQIKSLAQYEAIPTNIGAVTSPCWLNKHDVRGAFQFQI